MGIEIVGDHFQNEDSSVKVSQETASWLFEPKDNLSINVGLERGDENIHHGFVGIYETREGLLQLADLLTAIAMIDQVAIADSNCPPEEGIHVTLHPGRELSSDQVTLYVGRLDRKSDGELQWLSKSEQVVIVDESEK